MTRFLTRRTLLAGGAASVTATGAASVGVYEGVLPGRVLLQGAFGLNGEDGVVPDVATGPVESGSFVSQARLGATVRWHLLRPPGTTAADALPLVVALHGLHWEIDSFLPGDLGVAEFLAVAVAGGTPPYAIVVPEGGDTYWHERPDGEDAGAMVVDELLPLMAERGLRTRPTDKVGLVGWSMGGFGALHLAGVLGATRTAAVAVAGPAIWSDAAEASSSGFVDAAEYDAVNLFDQRELLNGIPLSIDVGTGDPFYRDVEDYVDGFADDAEIHSTIEAGAHDRGFWRRMMPAQLEFLGARVG